MDSTLGPTDPKPQKCWTAPSWDLCAASWIGIQSPDFSFFFWRKKITSFWSSPCRVMVTGALSGPSIVHGDDPTMFLCSVHLPWQGRRPRSKTTEEKETLAGGPAGPPWNRAAAICLLPLFPINCHLWLSLINCYRWFSCRKFNSIGRKKHAIFVSPYKLLKNRFKFYHMIIIMHYKY